MNHLTSVFFALICCCSSSSADNVRHEIAIIDTPAEDYLSICGAEFDVEGGGYYTCTIDLDGDGLNDQMFANAATSGTGGQAATIYLARKDGKFTRVGSLGHGAISTETIRSGGRLLHCSWNGGGGHSAITTYLVSHKGLKEIMTIQGEWKDNEYKSLFEKVFQKSLKPRYEFVATRPEPKAEQGAAGNPLPVE